MRGFRADAPTLVVTTRFFFFKKYQLYIPLDGLYDVQHYTIADQKRFAEEKRKAKENSNATPTN